MTLPTPTNLIQVPKPELGRATDRRVTQEYIDARPELAGFPAFAEGVDVDLVERFNVALAQVHSLVAYADPALRLQLLAAIDTGTTDLILYTNTIEARLAEVEAARDTAIASAGRIPWGGTTATIPMTPGFYQLTASGEVHERLEDGTLTPRPTLIPASRTEIVAIEGGLTGLKRQIETTRAALSGGTVDVGEALRLLADGSQFDVLPNAVAPSVDNSMVFQLAGGKRAVRNINTVGEITTAMFEVPNDGVTDASPALQRAINYAVAKNLRLKPLPGSYALMTELFTNGTLHMGTAGNGWVPTVTFKAMAPMTSVLNIQGQFTVVEGIMFDANKQADYAVHERGSVYGVFDGCGFRNAILDNTHRSATTNAGAVANNDGTEYYNCVWIYAGRVFGTPAMLARPEYHTEWTLSNQLVSVAGTISVTAGGAVVTGVGTDFTAMRIRRGDTVRLGAGWGDAQPPVLLEILSVDSPTQLTLAETSPVSLVGQGYAVHVGDNFHEQDALDNNISRVYGGFSRGAAGSGFLMAGVYGDSMIATASDYNLGWGFRVGRRSAQYHTFYPMLFNPYLEANFFGAIDTGKSINFRMIGGQDGTGNGYGPFLRYNTTVNEVRNGLIIGVGNTALQAFGTIAPTVSSGFTLPRSGHADNGDLNSAAYWGNTFPVGLTFTAINGATNVPGGQNLGNLQTFIDPTYLRDGGGFSYQMWIPAAGGGDGRVLIRHAFGIAVNQPWGPWRVMSQIIQTAPAIVSTAALAVSNPPTQGEMQAIAQRANEAAAAANTLRSLGIAAGWLKG